MHLLRTYLKGLSFVGLLIFSALTWATAAHDLLHEHPAIAHKGCHSHKHVSHAPGHHHHHPGSHQHTDHQDSSLPEAPEQCDCLLAKCINQPVLATAHTPLVLISVVTGKARFIFEAQLPDYVQPRNFSRGPPSFSSATV